MSDPHADYLLLLAPENERVAHAQDLLSEMNSVTADDLLDHLAWNEIADALSGKLEAARARLEHDRGRLLRLVQALEAVVPPAPNAHDRDAANSWAATTGYLGAVRGLLETGSPNYVVGDSTYIDRVIDALTGEAVILPEEHPPWKETLDVKAIAPWGQQLADACEDACESARHGQAIVEEIVAQYLMFTNAPRSEQ